MTARSAASIPPPAALGPRLGLVAWLAVVAAALATVGLGVSAAPAAASGGVAAAGSADATGGARAECARCPEMVVVEPGSFVMGDESRRAAGEQPLRRVTIAHPFAYAPHKVSFRDWKRCVLGGLCRTLGATGTSSLDPVISVSWVDVQQYLAWLSLETGVEYRLLSEAEWEYVARQLAEGRTDLRRGGLEWTSDCWHADYAGAPTDGSSWDAGGDCRYHVARGQRPGETAAASRRYRFPFDAGDPALGFRVARTMPQ